MGKWLLMAIAAVVALKVGVAIFGGHEPSRDGWRDEASDIDAVLKSEEPVKIVPNTVARGVTASWDNRWGDEGGRTRNESRQAPVPMYHAPPTTFVPPMIRTK